MNGHTSSINSVFFSSCEKYIVSGSGNKINALTLLKNIFNIFINLDDKSIRVWEKELSNNIA